MTTPRSRSIKTSSISIARRTLKIKVNVKQVKTNQSLKKTQTLNRPRAFHEEILIVTRRKKAEVCVQPTRR
jgi:hypothetical protein